MKRKEHGYPVSIGAHMLREISVKSDAISPNEKREIDLPRYTGEATIERICFDRRSFVLLDFVTAADRMSLTAMNVGGSPMAFEAKVLLRMPREE